MPQSLKAQLTEPLTFASCGGCGWICFGCGRRRSTDSRASAAMPDGENLTRRAGRAASGCQRSLAEPGLSGLPGRGGIRRRSSKALRLALHSIISSATPGGFDPSQTGPRCIVREASGLQLLVPDLHTGLEANVCTAVQQERVWGHFQFIRISYGCRKIETKTLARLKSIEMETRAGL